MHVPHTIPVKDALANSTHHWALVRLLVQCLIDEALMRGTESSVGDRNDAWSTTSDTPIVCRIPIYDATKLCCPQNNMKLEPQMVPTILSNLMAHLQTQN